MDQNSLSPYHRYANTISPSPQPLSPATPAIYNITPNTTQFATTPSMIPQFIQTNQTPLVQFNHNNPFNVPPIISTIKSSPTANTDEPTSSTYANITEQNAAFNLLLDLDNQQFSINSGELSAISLSFLDGHYGSNAATELPRADVTNNHQMEQDNMTDSFTRFATEAIRELNDLDTYGNNGINNSNKF